MNSTELLGAVLVAVIGLSGTGLTVWASRHQAGQKQWLDQFDSIARELRAEVDRLKARVTDLEAEGKQNRRVLRVLRDYAQKLVDRMHAGGMDVPEPPAELKEYPWE